MPQSVKPNDKDFINELLVRQDDVIGELDKLEAEILETIESLNTARREEQEHGTHSVASEESDTIKITRPEQVTDADHDLTSRAA